MAWNLGLLGAAGAGGAGPGAPYWISAIGTSGNDASFGLAIDSSNNTYLIGYGNTFGAGSNDALLVKTDSSGIIQWARSLGTSNSDIAYKAVVDSSDNVYIAGTTPVSGNTSMFLSKFNSSGTNQWTKTINNPNEYSLPLTNLAIDSSNGIYLVGYGQPGAYLNTMGHIFKFDTSGSNVWGRRFGGVFGVAYGDVSFDSSGNIYLAGVYEDNPYPTYKLHVTKLNSSATKQWERTLDGGEQFAPNQFQIAVSSTGTVTAVGLTKAEGPGNTSILMGQWNSSGTLQWKKYIGGTGTDYFYGLTLDSSNNIWAVGTTSSEGAGSNDSLIMKFNSSGTVQLQRTIGSSGNDQLRQLEFNSSGDFLVTGYLNGPIGGQDFWTARLPSDGSLTETYDLGGVQITYQASSLSVGTSVATEASPSGATDTISYNYLTLSATVGTPTLSQTII